MPCNGEQYIQRPYLRDCGSSLLPLGVAPDLLPHPTTLPTLSPLHWSWSVLAANLLCRLPDPRQFLRRLPSLIKPGGVSCRGRSRQEVLICTHPAVLPHAQLSRAEQGMPLQSLCSHSAEGMGVEGASRSTFSGVLCRSVVVCLPQVLVLVSPYSWLPAWTPKEQWLGGFTDKVGSGGPSMGFAGQGCISERP